MELYKELLVHALCQTNTHITFPDLQIAPSQLVECTSYHALQKIKAVLENPDLDDESCFKKIEEIVCIFEELGSSCGGRHDFG